MESTWAPDGVPRRDHVPSQPGSRQSASLPTVHDALPFSPFSSIVPFNPAIIAAPTTLQHLSQTAHSASEECQTAQRVLRDLNASANSAEGASRRCQQTLKDVQRLLNPDGMIDLVFKPRKKAHATLVTGATAPKHAPELSPFAKMVMEKAKVDYRYPSPVSPKKEEKQDVKSIKPKATPTLNGTGSHHVSVATNGFHSSAAAPISPTVQVVMPSSASVDRSQYQVHVTEGKRHISIDQKQRLDLAVAGLQDLLATIFDAEEQLATFAGEPSVVDPETILTVRDTEDGPALTMRPDIQVKLESSLQKVITGDRLTHCPVDDLIRVQRLNDGAVATIQSSVLILHDDPSEVDVEEWLVKIAEADTGLAATRITMRIMAGSPHQKELQSDTYLRRILEALKNCIEGFIVPLAETPAHNGEKGRSKKDVASANAKFTVLASHRPILQSLLSAGTRALRLMGDLLIKTDFDPVNISSVESLCTTIIFAENAANDRESVVGIQNFETIRRCAMDVMAKIFTKYPDQRQYIFDEILFSLEKLPATKQSARQYRLPDAKPIQLVSALLMRLIQTSANRSYESQGIDDANDGNNENGSDDDDDDDDDAEGSSDDSSIVRAARKPRRNPGGKSILSTVKPLIESSEKHAAYVVRYLINRASSTTKSGDEPYRKLLDIFVEDFLNVLGHCDWPAAELLLYHLARHMVGIAENSKSPAPSRTMALEFLGIMGSGVLDLHIATRNSAQTIDSRSSTGQRLAQMVSQAESGDLDHNSVIAVDGPFRATVEWLNLRGEEDSQSQSALGYHVTTWAFEVGTATSVRVNEQDAVLLTTLTHMVKDPHWLGENSDMAIVPDAEARLATKVLTLDSKFCKAFNRFFATLLSSMSSEQPTVRSRSLKSIDTLLEKDPTVLDRNSNILQPIFQRTNDASPLVRDSALGLIAKCISLRPNLDDSVCQQVVTRTRDNAPGVKRRAIKILKDIYLRNDSMPIRSAIANAVIARVQDVDDNIAELARTIVEEIFFQPFYGTKLEGENAVQSRVAFRAHVALLIQTLEESEEAGGVFSALLGRLLYRSKASTSNIAVCRTLIAVLFDGIIDANDIEGSPTQDVILRTLTVFAKACPKLFTAAQLERLEPYLANLTTSEDLEIYRSAVVILRHALPHQTLLKQEALKHLQASLLKTISKIPKSEMKDVAQEVAPCVRTISEMTDGAGMLSNFVRSAVVGVSRLGSEDLKASEPLIAKAVRLICIVGEFGKACDFTSLLEEWKAVAFPASKAESVPALMAQILCQFASPEQPVDVRVAALGAVCSISQSWPKQFLRADVTTTFETVFRERDARLEEALLSGLEAFFCAQEKPEDGVAQDVAALGSGVASGKERLGGTYVASDQDSALTSMAQRFLGHIRRLALTACNEAGFIAARLIITINSQGLGHPKDSAPALVALETCPNHVIAKRAFEAHKDQGLSRESVFEKEYTRGVQMALEYQQRVTGETTGHIGQPPVAKLHFLWQVLKAGKAGIRAKFLGNMSRRLDFDMATVEPTHLHFVQFCLGNLAFFDYDKVDEIVTLVTGLEKTFSATGTLVAQAIESEVLQLQVDGLINSIADDPSMAVLSEPQRPGLDPARLDQLTLAAQILCLVWETRCFLRRLWNLQKHMGKAKNASKEGGNKNAYRATHAPSLTEAHLRRNEEILGVANMEAAQRAMCDNFVETFTVDNEVKIGRSDDDAAGDDGDGYVTPSDVGSGKSASHPPGSGSTRGKKRKLSGANGTPRKKGRASFGKKKTTSFTKGRDSDDDDDDDDEDGGWV